MFLIDRTCLLLLCTGLILSACKKNNHQTSFSPPIVDFNWTGEQSAPATIKFNNNSLLASTFKWTFGNGMQSNERSPAAVTYTHPGSYEVVLTASEGAQVRSLKRTIIIAPNNDPVALFSYKFKTPAVAPAVIDFINESVNADSYEWDINGVSHIVTNPSNIPFKYAGDYKVKLTAMKGNKVSPVYETTITILANTEPLARFTMAYHPYPYTAGEDIQLVNKSQNSDSWTWTFGPNGPAPTTEQHPLVRFAGPGIYPITLVAKKGAKTSAAFTINLKIN